MEGPQSKTTDPFILLDSELAGCHNNEDHGFGFAMVTKRFLLTFGEKKTRHVSLIQRKSSPPFTSKCPSFPPQNTFPEVKVKCFQN